MAGFDPMTMLANAGGNFLDGIMKGVGNHVMGKMFPSTQRLSNKDLVWYNNQADYTNSREVTRQNAFLEGVTPTQANAYNTYQGMTYGADTMRMEQRMDSLFPGTSPWERLGAGAASPLPSPTMGNPQGGSGGGRDFLSSLVPIATAKIGQDTALKTAAINAQTQLAITDKNNMTSKENVATQTDSGRLPSAQTATEQARRALTNAQELNTMTNTRAAENAIALDTIKTVMSMIPEEKIDLGVYSYTAKRGWEHASKLLAKNGYLGPGKDSEGEGQLAQAIANMSSGDWDAFTKDIIALASLLSKGAKDAGSILGNFSKVTGAVKGMIP